MPETKPRGIASRSPEPEMDGVMRRAGAGGVRGPMEFKAINRVLKGALDLVGHLINRGYRS